MSGGGDVFERVGIVWNPTKVEERTLRDAVDEAFGDADQVLWWPTAADDPGRAMAVEAVEAGCDALVAVGGDGTVRAVAEVLAAAGERAPRLGIVPQGTGNLLARNLGIPVGSIPRALETVAAGEHRDVDMGWVRLGDEDPETGFLVMIGFGLDAHMLAETDDSLKDRAGWLAYVEAMGRALSAAENVDFDLTVDDERLSVSGHTLLVGNCGAIQGGIPLLPDAQPDDGLLDLLVVSADSAVQWMQTLRTIVWDNGLRRLISREEETVSLDPAQHLTGTRVRVRLNEPIAFEIDGEEAGEVAAFDVRVQPAALRILC